MRPFRTFAVVVAVFWALALGPRSAASTGPLVFVLNAVDKQVVLVDVATHTVVRKISLLFYPGGQVFTPTRIAVTPDGRYAYVTSQDCRYTTPSGQAASGCFFVISTDSQAIVATNTSITGKPGSLAIGPNGREVWIADESDAGRLWVVGTETNQVVRTYDLGAGIASVEVAPDGSFAVVSQPSLGTITIVRLPGGQMTRIQPGPSPHATAISPDARAVYVATYGGVVKIAADTGLIEWSQPALQTGAYVETLRAGRKKYLGLAPEEDLVLYVAYRTPPTGPGGIELIDPAQPTVDARRVPCATRLPCVTVDRALDILLNPTSGVLYVANNSGANTGQLLAFVPPTFDSPARTLAVGKSATALAMPAGGDLFLQVSTREIVVLTDVNPQAALSPQLVTVADADGRSFAWTTRTTPPPAGGQQWLKLEPATGSGAPASIAVSILPSSLPQDGFGRVQLGEHTRDFTVVDTAFLTQRTVRVRVVAVVQVMRQYFPGIDKPW